MHPRSTCSHADQGPSPGGIICQLKIVKDDTHVGYCRTCPSNTNRVPLDPATISRIQQQRRGCHGCGDSPIEGI